MFKVAFPGATDEEEKREMDWVSFKRSSRADSHPFSQVRSSYDTRNTNGGRTGENVRLAGQW